MIMASLSSLLLFLLTAAAITCCHVAADDDNTFGLDFHHRFSDKVREWARSNGLPATWQADDIKPGTPEYYKALLRNDFHRHRGRSLASGDLYSFADGNETTLFLGHIHYALVEVGTPNQTFLVALDTGSQVFWLPCNCKSCAPHSSPKYGNIVFRDYKPEESTTSKSIPCSSTNCDSRLKKFCTGVTTDCVYQLIYGDNSSSSGVMLQDVLLLQKETTPTKLVQLPITFGCAQVQTGALLNTIAPNGLMGLGYDSLSVPNMIASNGLTTDSFSMCFGRDATGRLNFGDIGSSSQYETNLLIDNISPLYTISITGMTVGAKTSSEAFNAIIDSGTSYPIFEDTIYTELTTIFDSQVQDARIDNSTDLLGFEFCYVPSSSTVFVPRLNFKTKGGSQFMVLHPAVGYPDKKGNLVAYCLAMNSGDINIIGEQFLTGLKIVFNRKKLVFGWEPSNCYGTVTNDSPSPPPSPPPPSPPPSPPSTTPRSPIAPSVVPARAPHVRPATLLSTVTCLFVLSFLMVYFR